MDGPDRDRQHRSGRRVLPGPPAVAAQPADPQVPGDPVMRDLQGVQLRGGPPAAERARRATSAPGCTATRSGSRCTSTAPVGDETGWVMDFADITAACEPLHDAARPPLPQRDRRPREPDQRECSPAGSGTGSRRRCRGLSKVVVRETCTSGCTYQVNNGARHHLCNVRQHPRRRPRRLWQGSSGERSGGVPKAR